MRKKSTVLTKKELDVLILGAGHLDCKHLSNAEIAQHLGISVSTVKAIIHQACIKLGAHNRNEAIVTALKRGEIGLCEIYSFDEIADRFKSLGPNMLRRIAYLVRQGLEYGYFLENYEQITPRYRRQDVILTKTERDILILVGYGFTNREIADRLFMSTSSVGTFLYRICTKMGVCKRADAIMLAVKRGEINTCDVFSANEVMRMFAPLGAESIEKVAQLVNQKLEQEHTTTLQLI